MNALMFFYFINASLFQVAIQHSATNWTDYPYWIEFGDIPQPPAGAGWATLGMSLFEINTYGKKSCRIILRRDLGDLLRSTIVHELCHCDRWMHNRFRGEYNSTREEAICEWQALTTKLGG